MSVATKMRFGAVAVAVAVAGWVIVAVISDSAVEDTVVGDGFAAGVAASQPLPDEEADESVPLPPPVGEPPPATRATQASARDVIARSGIAFVRLKHRGDGWDDGHPQAGKALLSYIGERIYWDVEGGPREPLEAEDLAKYPPGAGPAVIYLTGHGAIVLTAAEVNALRDYLVESKAMLFADAGSPEFDRSFRLMVGRMFGRGAMETVADDDPICRAPNVLRHGPPPLWHHGGFACRQVRDEAGNRLVFYHPGDLNDAWKPGGGGLKPAAVDEAFQLGANIFFHGIRQYVNANRQRANDAASAP